ncbi:UDP-glucose 4-epimerase [Paraburkholderia guartelaensis]|uniref:UDP-glucose 4-epimerase n=1 Tax=Paraburkholderia guartelaensis TaxID=2546446 RepID=A0A4R5LBX7_9BURK|nr:UDP-glucose 4-epimerase [Paraburkholderia guartelaensis]TDG06534.1 UDP-glucose 4-epimerase [Paraburkholderia guartelaensis]
MTLKGTVDSGVWHVEAETSQAEQGGFCCLISVAHGSAEQHFHHAFAHHRIFESEVAAVLEGLREGMVWVDLKSRHAFDI